MGWQQPHADPWSGQKMGRMQVVILIEISRGVNYSRIGNLIVPRPRCTPAWLGHCCGAGAIKARNHIYAISTQCVDCAVLDTENAHACVRDFSW